MSSSDYLLELVRCALEEFDDRPLEVSVRRAVRIAVLLGESEVAIRLALELKPIGGSPTANAADTQRMMADPAAWSDPDGPAERAMVAYLADRAIPGEERIVAHSLEELAFWDREFEDIKAGLTDRQLAESLERKLLSHQILLRTRHRTFAALCAWERRLTYRHTNEDIFHRFRERVDAQLAEGAPQMLDRFNAVYRRLREAAARGDQATFSEELAQAVTTCRRILKSVADHVYPARAETSEEGHGLDNEKYRNRIREFTKQAVASESVEEAVSASLNGLFERFAAIDKLANKGVHADVALAEAELCAISTYLVAGELLRVAEERPSGPSARGRT